MMNVVIDAGRFILCPDEALDEALSRVGVDRKGLVEVAEGVYATHEAIEAAKKPRKVFDFLPELNTCGREVRRALKILLKK
jgi:hypothetical protein